MCVYVCVYTYICIYLHTYIYIYIHVLGCEIPRKENSPIFFLHPPPLPVSPGSPEVDPTIDKNKRPGFKKLG